MSRSWVSPLGSLLSLQPAAKIARAANSENIFPNREPVKRMRMPFRSEGSGRYAWSIERVGGAVKTGRPRTAVWRTGAWAHGRIGALAHWRIGALAHWRARDRLLPTRRLSGRAPKRRCVRAPKP